jgi:hypothetical protein
LEQHCFDPIKSNKLTRYLQQGPSSLAIFPRFSTVIAELERAPLSRQVSQIGNLYQLVNPRFNLDVQLNIDYRNTFIMINRSEDGVNTFYEIFNREDQLLVKSVNWTQLVQLAQDQELDLVTQWRIFTLRSGCPASANRTKQYLQTSLGNLRKSIIDQTKRWFSQGDDVSKLDAFYLLVYFQTYLYFNALILNI